MLLNVFRERNYRLFFSGQGLSLIGSWIQSTTFNWLLYKLTDSALELGYLTALMNLPVLLLLPLAGSLVDRFDRRRLLFVLQSLFMLQALILGVITHFELLSLWLVVTMGCVQSLLTAFDGPARQAIVPRLVSDKTTLPAAISMNSMLFNSTRAIGPPIAGWLMAQLGPAPCFLLNALSYLFMLVALLLIRLSAPVVSTRHPVRQGALSNLRLIFRTPALRYPILSFLSVAVASMSVYVLLPLWAHEVMGTGVQGLGWLMGGIGVGALMGALLVGLQRKSERLWPLFRQAAILLGLTLILLSRANSAWSVWPVTVMLGIAYIAQGVAANTLLQLGIDDNHRAGVMAFYLLASFGSIPIGNLIGGWLGQWLGLHGAALVSGIAILFITALFWPTSNRVIRAAREAAALSADGGSKEK